MNSSNTTLAVALIFALTQTACASSGAAAGAPKSAGSEAAPYYWYDDGQRRELTVDPESVADFRVSPAGASAPAGETRAAGILAKGGIAGSGPLRPKAAVEKGPDGGLPEGVSPVLREVSAPAGQVRALPGGVIVTLRMAPAGTDAHEREALARRMLLDAQLQPLRAIDAEHRVWLVAAPAGLASLELANRLHESGAFEAVSPNWWRPRALK